MTFYNAVDMPNGCQSNGFLTFVLLFCHPEVVPAIKKIADVTHKTQKRWWKKIAWEKSGFMVHFIAWRCQFRARWLYDELPLWPAIETLPLWVFNRILLFKNNRFRTSIRELTLIRHRTSSKAWKQVLTYQFSITIYIKDRDLTNIVRSMV